MWNADRKIREEREKLSRSMAMFMSLILTVEIMVAAAMFLNIDFLKADVIALAFAFMVLYFGIVALLTNK
jgi:hypothetical protein